MSYLITLMQRLGLFEPKQEAADMFAQRLTRLNSREARHNTRSSVFVRNPV